MSAYARNIRWPIARNTRGLRRPGHPAEYKSHTPSWREPRGAAARWSRRSKRRPRSRSGRGTTAQIRHGRGLHGRATVLPAPRTVCAVIRSGGASRN